MQVFLSYWIESCVTHCSMDSIPWVILEGKRYYMICKLAVNLGALLNRQQRLLGTQRHHHSCLEKGSETEIPVAGDDLLLGRSEVEALPLLQTAQHLASH